MRIEAAGCAQVRAPVSPQSITNTDLEKAQSVGDLSNKEEGETPNEAFGITESDAPVFQQDESIGDLGQGIENVRR